MARSILVVGGGIAGSAAATLLGRAGHHVTLVERDQGLRSSGSPVDVRGPALPVVDGLGIAEALRRSDTGVRHVEFVDGQGRPRARASMRRDDTADVEISRSELTRILWDRAAAVAELVTGDGPTTITPDGDGGVQVGLESGRRSRFDLVVGADGQHSTVRRLVFGEEGAFSRPLGLVVATAPVDPSLVTTCGPGSSPRTAARATGRPYSCRSRPRASRCATPSSGWSGASREI